METSPLLSCLCLHKANKASASSASVYERALHLLSDSYKTVLARACLTKSLPVLGCEPGGAEASSAWYPVRMDVERT